MAYLQVESGELAGQKFEIGTEPLVVGRAPENQVVLNDGAVSSRHCHLVREGAFCKVVDLDSTNGTLLNDVPVKQSLLQDGDLISVGPVVMSFRSGDDAGEETAPEEVEEQAEAEDEEPSGPGLEQPSPRASGRDAFKPRHRKNVIAIPVILAVTICVLAAGLFFLRRLFSY